MTERENSEIELELIIQKKKMREKLKDWLAHANSDWSLTEGVGYSSLVHVSAWLQPSLSHPLTLHGELKILGHNQPLNCTFELNLLKKLYAHSFNYRTANSIEYKS